jgi:Ring finger domain
MEPCTATTLKGTVCRHKACEECRDVDASYMLCKTHAKIFKQNQALEECVICYNKLSRIKKLPCGHEFCGKCIDRWLRTSNTCPTCRNPVTPVVTNETPTEIILSQFRELLMSEDDEIFGEASELAVGTFASFLEHLVFQNAFNGEINNVAL